MRSSLVAPNNLRPNLEHILGSYHNQLFSCYIKPSKFYNEKVIPIWDIHSILIRKEYHKVFLYFQLIPKLFNLQPLHFWWNRRDSHFNRIKILFFSHQKILIVAKATVFYWGQKGVYFLDLPSLKNPLIASRELSFSPTNLCVTHLLPSGLIFELRFSAIFYLKN